MKDKPIVRFGFWIAAAFFLFEPTVGFLDLLPDVIGYFFLYLGFSLIPFANSHLEESREKLKKLLWIGVGQLLLEWLIYGVMGQQKGLNPYEQPVAALTGAFTVAVLQVLFLIPALKELILGLEQTTERFDGSWNGTDRKGKTLTERLTGSVSAAIIVKNLCSMIPEATVLASFEADTGKAFFRQVDFYSFRSLFLYFCILITLSVGTVTTVKWIKTWNHARKDNEWMEAVKSFIIGDDSYRDCNSAEERSLFSVYSFFLVLIFATSAVLPINDTRLLSGIIPSLFAIVAILYYGREYPHRKRDLIVSVISLIVSFTSYLTRSAFLRQYIPESANYETGAYSAFLKVQTVETFEAVAVGFLSFLLLLSFWQILKPHLTVTYESPETHLIEEEISNRSTRKLRKSFLKIVIPEAVLIVLSTVSNATYAVVQLIYSYFWWISFALTAAIVILCMVIRNNALEEMTFLCKEPQRHPLEKGESRVLHR